MERLLDHVVMVGRMKRIKYLDIDDIQSCAHAIITFITATSVSAPITTIMGEVAATRSD